MKTLPSNEDTVAASLNRISKILAAMLLRDIAEDDQARKIQRLASCGFSNNEIADFVSTTPATVRMTLSRAKKARRK